MFTAGNTGFFLREIKPGKYRVIMGFGANKYSHLMLEINLDIVIYWLFDAKDLSSRPQKTLETFVIMILMV